MMAQREVALGRLFCREKVLGYVDEQMLSVYRDRGVVVKNEVTNPNKTAEDRSIYQLVEPGWLVVNRMKAWQGAVGISDLRGIVSGHYICFRPTHGENDRYLHYLLRSPVFTSRFASISRGVRPGQIEIDNDELALTRLSLPSWENQQRIADFLDDQVARIDNIIAARQKQADLLDEAFSALAEAKLWPRAIPPTWTVDRLNRWAKIGNGSTPRREDRSYWEGGDVPWLNSSVVNLNEVIAADQFVTEYALAKCHLPVVRPGSVLVGLTGEGRTRGMATLLSIPSTINQHLAFVTGDDHHWQPGYLLWALRSAYGRLRHISDVNGSTKGGLTCGDLGDLRIPRPSFAEQVALVAEIEDVGAATRLTREALGRSLTCFGEFRRSLITAAVTGEFDVSSADGSRVKI